MTAIYRSDTTNVSEFGLYLRTLENPLDCSCISAQNLDYIWHNYRQNWLILIEEKSHNASQSFAQKDTHSIISQMLTFASGQPVKNARGKIIHMEYRGYYLVQFQNTQPDNSAFVSINGVRFPHAPSAIRFLLRHGKAPQLSRKD